MGVEPTRDGGYRPATVLKTAETTGPPPLPQAIFGAFVPYDARRDAHRSIRHRSDTPLHDDDAVRQNRVTAT
jgi:hypothetical protein